MLPNDLRELGDNGGLPLVAVSESRGLRASPLDVESGRDTPDLLRIGNAGSGWLARYRICDRSGNFVAVFIVVQMLGNSDAEPRNWLAMGRTGLTFCGESGGDDVFRDSSDDCRRGY